MSGWPDFLPQAGHVSLHRILFLLGPRPSALSPAVTRVDMTARASASLVFCSGAARAAVSEGCMRMASWAGHTSYLLLTYTV